MDETGALTKGASLSLLRNRRKYRINDSKFTHLTLTTQLLIYYSFTASKTAPSCTSTSYSSRSLLRLLNCSPITCHNGFLPYLYAYACSLSQPYCPYFTVPPMRHHLRGIYKTRHRFSVQFHPLSYRLLSSSSSYGHSFVGPPQLY